jgi:hypothetical protein
VINSACTELFGKSSRSANWENVYPFRDLATVSRIANPRSNAGTEGVFSELTIASLIDSASWIQLDSNRRYIGDAQ